MAKIVLDFMAEKLREASVTHFTFPDIGFCISIKSDKAELELDLPQAAFESLLRSIQDVKQEWDRKGE
jgi:hypothetical protein